MKKHILVGIIIISIIILGFIIAIFLPEPVGCTQKYCRCSEDVSDIPCNSCSISKPIFSLGFIHIARVCSGQEILICENGINSDRRIDIDEDNCRYKAYIWS